MFESLFVGNPEDRLCWDKAHMRNIEISGPLVEPLKPLETFNLVAIL